MEVAMPKDLQQEASLAKRRYTDVCRQGRIFDARNRIIGGDTRAWDVQVRDQKIKEATDKVKNETFAAEMKHNDKAMCIMHDREQRHRKQLCREINDYQQNFQKPETRREFDLSDPLALKKELPARVSDNDMRNTISGMQKFMGEDLNFQERKRIQKEQNREWCLQQYGEWEKARADQKLAEYLHTQTILKFDEAARDLEKLEGTTRKEVCAAVKAFNMNQVVELAERRRQEKQQEQEDNLTEITNLLHGDLLSENSQQAASSFGPSRVARNRWKGMTREQLEDIWYTQKQQIQEKQRLQEEERQRSMDWDLRRTRKAQASLLHERQQQRLLREQRKALDCSNLNLARQQYIRKQTMDAACSSQPTEDYFSQFNTRGR